MRPFRVVAWCAPALAAFASVASADTLVLTPTKDNTLFQSATGSLSSGLDDHFFAGRAGNNLVQRGILAFDASAIPAGSVVTAATLTLKMDRTRADDQSISLHRVLADWGEGTSTAGSGGGAGGPATAGSVTWIHRFHNNQFWATEGGDFVLSPSAITTVGGEGEYDWSSAALAADVQFWVDNPSLSHGWLMRGNENQSTTSKRFASRQAPAPDRPRLTIVFTPPSGTGACCLPGNACQILSPAECSAQGGVYRGDAAPCSPNPCAPPPTGACCLGSGACFVLTQPSCAASGGVYKGDGVACSSGLCPVVLTPFVDALQIPIIAEPLTGNPGAEATYYMTAVEFSQRLHRDLPPTRLWGYNGFYPGPTVEAGRDRPVNMIYVNDLRNPQGQLRTQHYLPVDPCMHGPNTLGPTARLVTHLHGGHVPAAFDGYPESTILPGQQAPTYTYPNSQLPATLWYHDHALGITRLNVYMGLAGAYIIRDPFEQSLGLPANDNEVPLLIQDRSFNNDGTLKYPAMWMDHFFGDYILVNGRVWPYFNVKRGKYRFRLVNGSNARTCTLSLSNGMPIVQIGGDGGLLPAPVTLDGLTLAPGERADVIVDFASLAPGAEVILTNSAPAPYPGSPGVGVIPNVMKFIVTQQGGFTGPIPASLRPAQPIAESEASVHREFMLSMMMEPCAGSMWMINDLGWEDITEAPRLGTTEVWSFINRSDMMHPMHLHLVQFQVLDRQPFQMQGGQVVPTGPRVPPPPGEAGWKDTVRVDPLEIVRVIARFENHTGLFAYHCHILEHEDHEMMRQFLVTCYANCDGSTTPPVLNVNDFVCFQQNFAAGNPYANCDGSTTPPVLNVNDFVCFQQRFAGGCD